MTSKIEWLQSADGRPGYSVNPVKGLCPMACDYCYARRMYKRFKWNPEIRFDHYPLSNLPDKPSRIFVGSTMELFGDWVKEGWMNLILEAVEDNPQHTFIFLTKQPQNLIKYSPFPPNVWVGVSITNEPFSLVDLYNIKATVRFVSLEPLRGHINISRHNLEDLNWVIIGQQTPIKETTRPNPEWIREIITACSSAFIPVFVKDNIINDSVLDLRLLEMRQEFPIISRG